MPFDDDGGNVYAVPVEQQLRILAIRLLRERHSSGERPKNRRDRGRNKTPNRLLAKYRDYTH